MCLKQSRACHGVAGTITLTCPGQYTQTLGPSFTVLPPSHTTYNYIITVLHACHTACQQSWFGWLPGNVRAWLGSLPAAKAWPTGTQEQQAGCTTTGGWLLRASNIIAMQTSQVLAMELTWGMWQGCQACWRWMNLAAK